MAGLLTHLIIAMVGFSVFAVGLKSWKYGAAFVLGHLIPDLISFGVTGIKQGSANPGVIMTNPLFSPLALISHSPVTWIIFGMVFFAIVLFLHNGKKISRATFKIWLVVIISFLTGLVVHLIIDLKIIETSYWI
jgi:hypothetical protein